MWTFPGGNLSTYCLTRKFYTISSCPSKILRMGEAQNWHGCRPPWKNFLLLIVWELRTFLWRSNDINLFAFWEIKIFLRRKYDNFLMNLKHTACQRQNNAFLKPKIKKFSLFFFFNNTRQKQIKALLLANHFLIC